MIKYNFLVYHAQYADFLEKIRKIGILHIATLDKGSQAYESLSDKFNLENQILKAIESCNNILKNSETAPDAPNNDASLEDGIILFENYNSLKKEEEALSANLIAAERELTRMAPWGEFNPEKIEKLKRAGYVIGFYNCQSRNFNPQWEKDYNSFIIENSGNTTYFITVTNEKIADIDAEEFKMNSKGYNDLKADVEKAKTEIIEKNKELITFAKENVNNLSNLALLVRDEINIDKVHINTIKAADDKIMVLEGYCPDELQVELNIVLDNNKVYYQTAVPTDEDDVPIKLRNNWFTRLFEPLTGMYGIPSYQEWDPTPVLAPFFLLFFAMCMGDSGYGILLVLFGLGVKYKKINVDMFEGMGNIITILGIGTLIVGFFLGTAFGINMAEADYIPQNLKSLMITGEVAGFNIQMVLAVAIGVVHICLAITLKAILYTKRFGFVKNISTWGWLLLILGSLITIIITMAGAIAVEAAEITLIVIGAISALGIYILNDPKRNPLINIGAGLWDTYNMATGLLGDVLSYIRLYALGLAGGMLGGAFNTLGLMVLGDEPSFIMYVPFIVILLLGHTLNLAMSVLGAFVHPLRLTFVEYFKNSGYEGKGEKYAPLAKSTTN